MKTLKRLFLLLVVLGIAAGLFGAQWFMKTVAAPGPLAAEKLVYIPPATPTNAIALRLQAEGIVGSALAFRLDARWKGRIESLKAGEYLIPARASIGDVISILQGGKTHQHQITFAEGMTSAEIVALLKNEAVLTGEVDPLPLDGTLLPETYNFSYGDSRAAIIARMKKEMDDAINELWEKRSPEFPLSKEDAIVLASIVEKETGVAHERPRVAGVFLNRLRKGIPLQSDPTVIYALTHGLQPLGRSLTRDDLRKPSAYNTYIATGLPPTAIANPGRASLEAVFSAEKHDYLYFVADGTGGHAFAGSLKEHNKNVAKWRLLEKKAQQ